MGYIGIAALVLIGVIIYLKSPLRAKKNKLNSETSTNKNDFEFIEENIKEFNNFEKIDNLTEASMRAIPDEKIEYALINYILEQKLTDYEKEKEIISSLPDGLIMLYSTWIFEAEVNNGGFNQYFYNSSNQFVEEAYQGLLEVGAVKHAELIKRAVDIFNDELDMQLKMREIGTIEAFSESYELTKLNEIDSLFYSIDENLSELRVRYIRENTKKFIVK